MQPYEYSPPIDLTCAPKFTLHRPERTSNAKLGRPYDSKRLYLSSEFSFVTRLSRQEYRRSS